MNTREEIINLLFKSENPLGPKKIAFELKKTSVNIRKILSNLCKEGKIVRVGYGKYALNVNVKNKKEYYDSQIKSLRERYDKLQHRLDKIYIDKLTEKG